jgi:hypothetical protein
MTCDTLLGDGTELGKDGSDGFGTDGVLTGGVLIGGVLTEGVLTEGTWTGGTLTGTFTGGTVTEGVGGLTVGTFSAWLGRACTHRSNDASARTAPPTTDRQPQCPR